MKKLYLQLAAALTLTIACQAQASVITNISNNTPVTVCDLCTVTSSVTVDQHGLIEDINAFFSDLRHGWDEDLILTLSHDLTSVVLVNRQGGSGGADFLNTMFDDTADLSINSGIAYAPFTGSFRPEEALSAFNGLDAYGLWTLTISDNEAGDSGELNSWGISATTTPIEVPEPSTLLLLGAGLFGLGLCRKIKYNA